MIDSAARSGVSRLCFLGSSCIYPRLAAQPMIEEALMTGPLEPTNAGYAIAKIAGLTMARAYQQRSGMKASVRCRAICTGPEIALTLRNPTS